MNSHFSHFGELYKYLESQPPKEDFLHHRLENGYENFSKEAFLLMVRYLALSFLACDDIEVGHGSKVPLWLFGFLY